MFLLLNLHPQHVSMTVQQYIHILEFGISMFSFKLDWQVCVDEAATKGIIDFSLLKGKRQSLL